MRPLHTLLLGVAFLASLPHLRRDGWPVTVALGAALLGALGADLAEGLGVWIGIAFALVPLAAVVWGAWRVRR